MDVGHHSDIGMPVYNGSIRAYISSLVDTIAARRPEEGRRARGLEEAL